MKKNKKHPDIICKCGDKIKDLHICPKCKQCNLGKRQIKVVKLKCLGDKTEMVS